MMCRAVSLSSAEAFWVILSFVVVVQRQSRAFAVAFARGIGGIHKCQALLQLCKIYAGTLSPFADGTRAVQKHMADGVALRGAFRAARAHSSSRSA